MTRLLGVVSLMVIAGIGLLMYVLTRDPTQEDPCLNPQNDISAAILGEDADQDGLANRAMLQRRLCEKRLKESVKH